MFETVRKALAKQLRIDENEIKPESTIMADLGADSIAILELLMTMEEDFGCPVPDEKLKDFKTVADIVAFLESVKK